VGRLQLKRCPPSSGRRSDDTAVCGIAVVRDGRYFTQNPYVKSAAPAAAATEGNLALLLSWLELDPDLLPAFGWEAEEVSARVGRKPK
jgi:hypothetical protein